MSDSAPAPYRVLARKYRPADFTTLIGQEAMVRTLSNAIAKGRIAQAFMLTGVRGTGKTTTARIIARALNCIGPDGKGGPTVEPCGVCANCTAIVEDRHPDVIEMDAASHNGVEGIRDLTDGVRYLPMQARYKVYILDEVHMLSKPAFNALLKTLEEPPAHVKFIFATTEIGAVPVTVLSRCQRFDLRRVGAEELIAHFSRIAVAEQAKVEAEAMALIARAAEGSVRDGLSLLDQAIAHGAGEVSAEQVRDMLGLADRARVVDLFELAMKGDIAAALQSLGEQYRSGADPSAVLQALLEFTHWVLRIKLVPETASDISVSPVERDKGREYAARLSVPVLNRAWSQLLKSLGEVRVAPNALSAAEMALIRLAYSADLPSPADLVRDVQAAPRATGPAPAAPSGGGGGGGGASASAMRAPALPRAEAQPVPGAPPRARLPDFDAVLALAKQNGDLALYGSLWNFVHLVAFDQGRIEFRPAPNAPRTLAGDLAGKLRQWTGDQWIVSVVSEGGAPTPHRQDLDRKADKKARAANDPSVLAVLKAFPGAEIIAVNDLAAAAPEAGEPVTDESAGED
jgi:DNA polymerase-3 subunit gamma/tau